MEGEDKYLDAFRRTLPVLIDKEMNKVRKQQRGLIGLVCVLLGVNLLFLGGAMWMFLSPGKALPEVAVAPVAPTTPVVPADGAEVEPVFTEDTIARNELEEPQISQESEEAESDDPLTVAAERAAELAAARDREERRVRQADAVVARQKKEEPRIPGYVITERGMTLRSLARRYYGSNVFWVCIYDRNMEALSSPDVLPLGIRLFLPRPADYGIDANDPSSLQRARKMGQSLLKQ